MVKKRVASAARFKLARRKAGIDSEEKRNGPEPPAHIQRKIARKVNFLDKVATSKAKVLAAKPSLKKKVSKKKKTLPSLNTLAESLGDILSDLKQQSTDTSTKPVQLRRVVSAAGRRYTETREAERLKKVLKNDFYKANPLAAVTGHLNAVLPPPPVPQKSQQQQRKKKQHKRNVKDGEDMQED